MELILAHQEGLRIDGYVDTLKTANTPANKQRFRMRLANSPAMLQADFNSMKPLMTKSQFLHLKCFFK